MGTGIGFFGSTAMQPIPAECRNNEIPNGEARYIGPHGGNHPRAIA